MAQTDTTNQGQPRGNKRVLIVEDEKPLSHALQMQLSNAGYSVAVAEDGEEAVRLAKVEQFDLILLDIIMPRMDGFTMLEKLRAAGQVSAQSVIILSNLGQKEDIERAKRLGVRDYLVKANNPISRIIGKVKEILG